MEPRGDSRRGSAWLRPPHSARSSAAARVASEEDDDVRARVSSRSSNCLRFEGIANVDILLEENADLTDRLSRAERKLHQAKRESRALREKVQVLEYEAKERLAAAEEDACNSEGTTKAKKTVAFSTGDVRPRTCSVEPPRKDTDPEEQQCQSFQEQLSDLENRYAAAMTEGATLRAELAEVEELGQSWLMDVEEVREVLHETQLTLEKERELLKEAQDEARRLRDELHALRLNEEDAKVVLAHYSSLHSPTQRRRKKKLVTANLMSQLETTEPCTVSSEDAVSSSAEATWDEVPEAVPETLPRVPANAREEKGQEHASGEDNAVDGNSSPHNTVAAVEDAGSMLHRRSCELFSDLQEARVVKERLQRNISDLQTQLAQTEARLRKEQCSPARRKSRELLEVRESECAVELEESRQSELTLKRTVRDLEQRLVLMERIATDWKRRAQGSQDSIWNRIGFSVWSSSFCATARPGVAPAA